MWIFNHHAVIHNDFVKDQEFVVGDNSQYDKRFGGGLKAHQGKRARAASDGYLPFGPKQDLHRVAAIFLWKE